MVGNFRTAVAGWLDSLPDFVGTDRHVLTRRAQWALIGTLGTLFVALTVMAVTGDWIAAMHGPGDVSAGPQGGLTGGVDHAQRAVQSWRDFHLADVANLYRDPDGIVRFYMLVDALLLVPSYLIAGGIVLLRGAAWAEGRHGRAGMKDRSTLRWGFLVLLATAVADEIENVLVPIVFAGLWPAGRVPDVEASTGTRVLAELLRVVSLAKWVAGGIAVLFLLVLLALYLYDRRQRLGTTLRLARVQLIGFVVLVAAVSAGPQVPDTILIWDIGQYLAVAALAVGLALAQWSLTRHALLRATADATRQKAENVPIPARFYLVGAGVVTVLAVAVAISGIGDGADRRTVITDVASGVLWPVIAAAAVWLVSTFVGGSARGIKPGDEADDVVADARGVLPRALAALVPAVIGLMTLRATFDTVVLRRHPVEWKRITGGVVLVGLGFVLYFFLGWLDRRLSATPRVMSWWRGGHLRLAVILGTLAAAVGALCVAAPFTVPRGLSAVGVVLAFMLVATVALGLLVIAAEWASTRYYLPALLRLFGLRRLPVFAVLLLWATTAARLDSGAHWEVRRLNNGTAARPLTLDEAWQSWLAAHTPTDPGPPGPGRQAVPLVVVASAGGGIRAATWTSLALRCVFEGQPAGNGSPCALPDAAVPGAGMPTGMHSSRVFLGSGISGGSLGLAEFVAHLASDEPPAEDWVSRHVAGDYVSGQLAWQLFVEVPRSVLHFRTTDRAEILERSWERSWDGSDGLARGLLAVQTDSVRLGRTPLLLLNGASVYDGCWVVASALREGLRQTPPPELAARLTRPGDCLSLEAFGSTTGIRVGRDGSVPATVDVGAYLCPGEDLRLSTAALVSARFPFVSPAGRLSPCRQQEGAGASGGSEVPETKYLLDGGIIEGSGAETALAVWARLRDLVASQNRRTDGPCVVPFFVQLDNGYISSTARGDVRAPNQLFAPATSVSAAGRGSRAERARAVAALEFTSALPGVTVVDGAGTAVVDRYARLVPRGHPGNQPTLGWALSELSQQDLRDQLVRENAGTIDEVQRWLTEPLRCT